MEVKFCPFLTNTVQVTLTASMEGEGDHTNGANYLIETQQFGQCNESCMAYNDGACSKIKAVEE